MSKSHGSSRKNVAKKSAGSAGGVSRSEVAGHGGPLKQRLALRITNPTALIIDPQMPRPQNGYLANECPPSVVTAAGHRQIFIACGRSMAVEVPVNTHLLHDRNAFQHAEPVWAIGGLDAEIIMGRLPLNTRYDRQTMYWRKNYCGAYNADVLPAADGHPEWIFSINHCENKNEVMTTRSRVGTYYFHNSINLNDPAGPGTCSGSDRKGVYQEYQAGYFGLVSMAYAPVTAGTRWGVELHQNDQGPILWPQTGFLTPDGKAVARGYTHEHPHPSSLIAEDPRDGKTCLYVFANISSTQPGKQCMVGAARSPIASRGLPGTFLNFYKGDYTEPSLPENMKEEIALLLTRKGGRADVIHPELYNVNRFFVARLKRSGLFLSVESYHAGGSFQTALRLSRDLRAWSERFVLPPSPAGSQPFSLYYPKFLSRDGSSHYLLDESEPFYLIATKPHALIYRELAIEII